MVGPFSAYQDNTGDTQPVLLPALRERELANFIL